MLDLTHCMETYSGKFVNLVDPHPDDFTLRDVAHGLSMTCRFGGQCRRFYSVAEHAMLVEDYLAYKRASLEVRLAGLHHDDSEAFITDVPRPAKPLVPAYVTLEEVVMRAILVGLGLEGLNIKHPEVKDADNWALAQEAHELMRSRGKNWQLGHEWDGTKRWLGELPPDEIEDMWIQVHEKIVKEMEAAA